MNKKSNDFDKGLLVLGGLGLGAGLMYLFDPNRGNHRRVLLRDKFVHTVHQTGDAVKSVGGNFRNFGNRSYGLLAGAKHWLRSGSVDDETLIARVRSQLGHTISHPSSVQVSADNGEVTLSGIIPAEELGELLSSVSKVRGVTEVESQLKVQRSSGKP